MSLRAVVLGSMFMLVGVQPYCHAQSSSDIPANPPIDEVLVTGERPGPGMWRISKDGHDLWILATLRPLPKNMTWRSVLVEQRIAGSQAVLSPPDVDVDVGFFRGITLIPGFLKRRRSGPRARRQAGRPERHRW